MQMARDEGLCMLALLLLEGKDNNLRAGVKANGLVACEGLGTVGGALTLQF
jgi:hypothetical protein